MSIINKFNVFSKIDHELVIKIKSFYITKEDLLFVTLDDNVFQYNIKDQRLLKIEDFIQSHGHVITKFSCGCGFYTSLTDSGRVYCWNYLRDEQSGGRSAKSVILRVNPMFSKLSNRYFIIDISCGDIHTLALTECGRVYAYGLNRSGQSGSSGTKSNQITLTKVSITIKSKVIAFSCGDRHSLALTECGQVFGWGSSIFSPTEVYSSIFWTLKFEELSPIQVNVPLIKQIMCGDYYALMLAFDGDVYFCGRIDSDVCKSVPKKLNTSTKFIKIAATKHSEMCVALSQSNKCFIIGNHWREENNKETIRELRETEFSSIAQTYAFFEQITYSCVNLVEKRTQFKKCFRQIDLIGCGGFSSVFKCEHRLTHKVYAIKKISFEVQSEVIVVNELNILNKLNSNFIVKFHNSWIENNYYRDVNEPKIKDLNHLFYSPLRTQLLHIQMELCSLTLRDAINTIVNECDITANTTLSLIGYYISSELLYEILECVQYLHQQNPTIIHRDLKPENILLINMNSNRIVKLSDFGLATFHDFSDQSHTKYKGTKGYKAPELSFSTRYTPKVDIYSLGIIILELFQIDINYKIKQSLFPLNEVKSLALSALNATPELRPDCSQMLSRHNKWCLNNKQLSLNEEFKEIICKIPKSNSIDDNFIEYFIQNKYDCNNNRTARNNSTDSFSSVFKSFLRIK